MKQCQIKLARSSTNVLIQNAEVTCRRRGNAAFATTTHAQNATKSKDRRETRLTSATPKTYKQCSLSERNAEIAVGAGLQFTEFTDVIKCGAQNVKLLLAGKREKLILGSFIIRISLNISEIQITIWCRAILEMLYAEECHGICAKQHEKLKPYLLINLECLLIT